MIFLAYLKPQQFFSLIFPVRQGKSARPGGAGRLPPVPARRGWAGEGLSNPGRQDLLIAEHLGAVELGDRGPAQLANLLRDLLGAGLEPRRVEIPAAQLDLASAVLDIGGVVLGKELDLWIGTLEPVMRLEGRQQDLADQ